MWLTISKRSCCLCHAIPAWLGVATRQFYCHSHAAGVTELVRPITMRDGL